MEKDNKKEEAEKGGNKLVNIVAGSVLGATAFLISGCDYMFSYSTYDPYYPRHEYRTIYPFFRYPYYDYRFPRPYYPHIHPPTHRYSVPSPRITPPRQHPPTRPSLPSIRPSPNRPSRPNIPHRDRK